MSTRPCIEFRQEQGQRVVAFEQTRGLAPWEAEQARRTAPVTRASGSLIGLIMADRAANRRGRPGPNDAVNRSGDSNRRAQEWARAVGFTERQVPFAAVRATVLKMGRKGGAVSKAEVEAQLRRMYPFLFDEKAGKP